MFKILTWILFLDGQILGDLVKDTPDEVKKGREWYRMFTIINQTLLYVFLTPQLD